MRQPRRRHISFAIRRARKLREEDRLPWRF